MYLVKFSTNDTQHMHMVPGGSYYMDDCNAGQYLITHRPEVCDRADPAKLGGNGDGILIVRAGGMGDLLQCAPLIRRLRADYLDQAIDFCAAYMFHDAIRYHPSIRSVINYPLEASLVNNYRRVIWLENAVEYNTTDHIADCFLAAAGYDPSQIPEDQKRPEYHMPKAPVEVVPRGTKQRIGIQCKASARCRTSNQTGAYIDALHKEGYEVVLFGRHGEIQCDVAGVINLAEKDLALHETGRWMQTCTAFLAPDSGLLHMANALRVPSVGLFSVIEAKLRMGYAPFCIAVQARAPCAPCHWHGRGGAFPPHCPTASKNVCGPLEAIKPELVVQAIKQVIENKRQWRKQIEGGVP